MKECKRTHHQPSDPKWTGTPSAHRFPAACSRLRFRNLRELGGHVSTLQISLSLKAKLTEVQISLGRQHQCFRFDAFHRGFEVAVVTFLFRYVAALPGGQHCEHVLGVCSNGDSAGAIRSSFNSEHHNIPLDKAHASQKFFMKSSRSLKPRTDSYSFSR